MRACEVGDAHATAGGNDTTDTNDVQDTESLAVRDVGNDYPSFLSFGQVCTHTIDTTW